MRRHMTLVAALIAALFVAFGGCASAGGLLGDAVKSVSPSAAIQAETATHDLNAAVQNYKQSAAGRTDSINQNLIGQSSTCLTAAGSCPIGSAALTGTACFCRFGSQTAFGTAQ